ncbi:flavin reductase (DIM6/NTAB) family NADH-FMN oxidoreductase RutF [Streptomyces turgidiscabies]|uniref:Flavin reductase (DIM6/NTAB) family NADH-FMN oxidoreductase RutF n=2 Tax=Streptomyces turgidiscabies TaxID=85558 RepID=A0ABU0RLE3_9ACTN|nr:flavin reductase (DIM6/NTAB) family NADH-FMN oxidoreductase RutF [Streptomyces turgidiscabies]
MTPASAELEPAVSRTGLRTSVEADSLREVMSQFATGVTVLTVGGDHIHAMTANAFSSVSLAPPTVLVSIAHSAVMYDAMTQGGHFGVNVLAAGQESLARHFADKKRTLGRAQFDDVQWEPGARTGAPLLAGALAWLECDVTDAHLSGDHTIFVGTVLDCRRGGDDAALTFFDGKFDRALRAA